MHILRILTGIIAVSSIAACGGSNKSSSNGGGGGSSGGGGTAGGGSAGGGGSSMTCAPSAACPAVDKSCIGLVDNSSATKFGLRMSQVTFAHPTTFASGLVSTTIAGATGLNLPSCNLTGEGNFSWLLQFDTSAGTLTTGGAKPVADPTTTSYAFDSEMISGFMVQSATMNATFGSAGQFTVATGVALNLPIFLDAAGTSAILLPVQQARISMGTLSTSHNCIGSYNATGLEPSMNCEPSAATPAFINGGSFDGFIKLTDADQVTIAVLSESLCVALSGNPSTYGDGASPVAHCKVDTGGAIVFQGDWCSTTNAAAAAGCADAVQLNGQFAASSVKIN